MEEKKKLAGPRLLRKPRAPIVKPVSTTTPQLNNDFYDKNPQHAFFPYTNQHDLTTPTHSVSPPPPTETQSRPLSKSYSRIGNASQSTHHHIQYRKGDGRYILDPLIRERTNLGTYVEGNSLVKPLQPRGPAPMPFREPRHNPPLLFSYLDENEARYHQPPAFSLEDFTQKVSEKANIPLEKVQTIMFSQHTYKRIQALLVERCIPKHPFLNTVNVTLSDENVQDLPRIPHQQLLIEMTALVKEHMLNATDTYMKSTIRPLPRFSPDYKPNADHAHTEILLYQENTRAKQERAKQLRQKTEIPGHDGFFHVPTTYFQGSRRSNSPFVTGDDTFITPSELAVLDAIMSGGFALSLKANFIGELPDIESLARTITYLNISFNNFKYIPLEIYDMQQLTVLKLRNNPIKEISPDIGRLKNLQTLVFSFCLVSSLPLELFELTKLVQLDLSYNKITCLPSEMANLICLRELSVEGNELAALPAGAMRLMRLKYIRVCNNFMHPLFWNESTVIEPQRLADLAALEIQRYKLDSRYTNIPEHITLVLSQKLECDLCHGPRYGPGIQIIRPVPKIFNTKNVPFLFHLCSLDCLDLLYHGNNDTLTELLYGVPSQVTTHEE